MLAVGYRQQGQHCAVVGQSVQTAGGDGCNAVEGFRADAQLGGLFQVLGAQGFQGDGHTAGGRTRGACQHIDSHCLRKQDGAGHIQHGVFQQRKAGNHLYHRTEAYGTSGVHNGSQRTGGTCVDGRQQFFQLVIVHQADSNDTTQQCHHDGLTGGQLCHTGVFQYRRQHIQQQNHYDQRNQAAEPMPARQIGSIEGHILMFGIFLKMLAVLSGLADAAFQVNVARSITM